MRKLIVAASVLAFAAIGFYGFSTYNHTKFVQSLVPHVKNVSLRVGNSTRFETEQSNITYKELFDRLEADIEEIDNRLLDVQSISSPRTAATSEPTVEYLKASQEYLRALLQKYRKQLALSRALELYENALDNLRPSSGYAYRYAQRHSDSAFENTNKAQEEYQQAIPELLSTIAALKEARTKVASIFPGDATIPLHQLDAVATKNESLAKDLADAPK